MSSDKRIGKSMSVVILNFYRKRFERFADIKFSSNTRPTFIQHDGKMLDGMLDLFKSALS